MSTSLSLRLHAAVRRISAAIAVSSLMACAGGVGTGGYNETTRSNDLRADILANSGLSTLVVAHINIGSPSRNYVERAEPRVDSRVTAYLKSNGYTVAPQREFSQRWENAKLIYGDPVDPTTGRVNRKTFVQLVTAVRDQMREQTNINGIVFTDLIEQDVFISSGVNRVARFDGVTRKPSLKGPGNGVTADFDWGQPMSAISLQVSVYNMELEQVFAGLGGIDMTDAIDTRSGRGFVRRKDVLENDDFIDEGIQLAFHPLITMTNWPGINPDAQ